MANEIQVRCGITINKPLNSGNTLQEKYTSPIQGYSKNKDNVGGPTPGMILVPIGGCAIDLSELTTPGECDVCNLDANNYVTLGIRDPNTGVFYPMIELGPGQSRPLPLSRWIREGWYNTGTGTTGNVNQFWADADTAACKVVFNTFEK